jgi:hypothetical protein
MDLLIITVSVIVIVGHMNAKKKQIFLSVDEMFNKIVYTQMNLDYPSIKVLLVHKAERSWSTVNLQVFITLFVNFPVSD